MPTTTFTLPTMITQADAEAVMFELQDLPCISNAGVDLAQHRAWAEHTRMIDPGDIAGALAAAGHEAADIETSDCVGGVGYASRLAKKLQGPSCPVFVMKSDSTA
jgi:hypothetical protein